MVERTPALPFELVLANNEGLIGPDGEDDRAAVAVHGEWAMCATPKGSAVAEAYRRMPDGAWEFHSLLKPACHVNAEWLPHILFLAADRLLVSAPMSATVLSFRFSGGAWLPDPSIAGDGQCQRFGMELAASGETIAVSGWCGQRFATWLTAPGSGKWQAQTRILNPEEKTRHAVSLSDGWLFVATGVEYSGDVHVFRAVPGGWCFHQSLENPRGSDMAGFGSSVAAGQDRLLVTSRQAGGQYPAAHWFRLRGDSWELESTLLLPETNGGHKAAFQGGLAAVGAPYCNSNTGRVHLLCERSGRWELAQTIERPGARPGDRFGESLSLDGSHLMIGAPGSVAGGGCGYLYRASHPLPEQP